MLLILTQKINLECNIAIMDIYNVLWNIAQDKHDDDGKEHHGHSFLL